MKHAGDEWQFVESAPFGRDIALAVIEKGQTHALAFPCRRTPDGWIRAQTGEPVRVEPSHWREWSERQS